MHAQALGLTPELWIGDFDSASPEDQANWPETRRERFPTDKDYTDGELAIGAALDLGASSVLLVGALGGARTDHAFSNLVLMIRCAAAGVKIAADDGVELAWPILPGRECFETQAGAPFSILRFSDVEGLSIRGARWPLENAVLPFHSILTQSNEALGPVEVDLGRGTAILVAQAEAVP